MARTRTWRNTTALIAVAALGLSACGGGDDDTDAVPAADDATNDAADEPATEPANESSDDDSSSSDDSDDSDDSASSGDGLSIRSVDDIPEACRDEMADFLRDLEPIVGGTDWETATISDMEAIGAEFEARADEFEEASIASGCDDLVFEDDNDFDLIIEFAKDEAPETVGFLTFLDDFTSAMTDTLDDTLGGDASASNDDAGFDDCESGIAYVEQLMDEYESITEAPMSEIAKLGELGMLMMTCTPEEMEFFDSDEVNAFLGG